MALTWRVSTLSAPFRSSCDWSIAKEFDQNFPSFVPTDQSQFEMDTSELLERSVKFMVNAPKPGLPTFKTRTGLGGFANEKTCKNLHASMDWIAYAYAQDEA